MKKITKLIYKIWYFFSKKTAGNYIVIYFIFFFPIIMMLTFCKPAQQKREYKEVVGVAGLLAIAFIVIWIILCYLIFKLNNFLEKKFKNNGLFIERY